MDDRNSDSTFTYDTALGFWLIIGDFLYLLRAPENFFLIHRLQQSVPNILSTIKRTMPASLLCQLPVPASHSFLELHRVTLPFPYGQ